MKKMKPKDIDRYITNCPYFWGKNGIDRKLVNGEYIHYGGCDLEFHHRKICPSVECICAKRFGLVE